MSKCMIAVIFEVWPNTEGRGEYLDIASRLRPLLESEGILSIERFESLNEDGKVLSLSFWRDEESVASWRNVVEHRLAQREGRERLFDAYRIRVAHVVRDYTASDRDEAPSDSNDALVPEDTNRSG